VALSITTTATMVAWAGDLMQKRQDQISKCSSRHLTMLPCRSLLDLLVEQC
jgi:hypothetical protein